MIKRGLLALIRAYQYVLSPWVGGGCRYWPTCSEYAREAIEVHGALKGSWMMLARLARCHPYGRGGVDPVPATLQVALLLRPEQGPLIKGGGGLRKVRWATKGIGKRGGIRVIYYWRPDDQVFYMLFAYTKVAREDLTPDQLRVLARIVREEFT